jgi:fructoselysine-6-P-deglycase FrlB-like protein
MEVASFADAMLSQPVELARLEARLDAQRVAFPEGVVPWRPGDTVLLAGMGAAHHSTHALACVLRANGFRAAPVIASEALGSNAAALGDHLLVVTESGRSPEPIALAREFPRGRRLAIERLPFEIEEFVHGQSDTKV